MKNNCPKRLIFVSHTLFPDTNAAASRIYERLKYIPDDKYEVIVITQSSSNNNFRKDIERPFKIIRLPSIFKNSRFLLLKAVSFSIFFFLSFFVSLFYAKKKSILFASSPQFLVLISAYLVSRFRRVFLVFEIADLWPDTIADLGYLNKQNQFYKFWKKL